MNTFCRNIYASARKAAGFSQEKAATLLNVSIRSLADYESGKTTPHDNIVISMIETYKASMLAYHHLKNSTEVGRRFLPEIHDYSLAQLVLWLHKEVNELEHINSDMIEIACDGRIDSEEMNRWDTVKNGVRKIAGAALALSLTS